MPGKTAINWTEESWNFLTGCSRTAPECENCYSERLTGTRLSQTPKYMGLAVLRGDGEYHFTGEVRFFPELLSWPYKKTRGSLIFTNAMSDPYHHNFSMAQRDDFFAAMLIANQHVFQVLTKRPAAMAEHVTDPICRERVFAAARRLWAEWNTSQKTGKTKPFPEDRLVWPIPHVWLGCSAGSQKSADKFFPELLKIGKGWMVWASAEPLIGPIVLRPEWMDANHRYRNSLQWIVVGGESGSRNNIRPMLPAWADGIRESCAQFGVPYWQKQPGNWRLMPQHDRERFVADLEFIDAAAATQAVCALDAEDNTVRGAHVAAELLRGPECALFWYEREKGGNSRYREFPQFPPTFLRAAELHKRAADYSDEPEDMTGGRFIAGPHALPA